MTTLEDYLERNARLYPEKTAMIDPDGQSLSYARLYESVVRKAAQFSDRKGRAVVFRNTQSSDFLITYLALHRAGVIAVPMESGTPEATMRTVEAELAAVDFPSEVADVLYTTGTTGRSKGVMISHSTLVADGENLIEAQGFCHETVFVVCGPMNHIGSLSKLYPVIMQGATLLILKGMKDLNAFFHALDYPEGRLATFLVPASIRILLAFGGQRLAHYADKIDFIETGAAPMAHSDMRQLCRLLPRTRLYNTYASTETGIIATYDFNDGRCLEKCLGHPMKHSSFHITRQGRIACEGKTLMIGYAGNDELTRQVLRNGVLYTADCGEIDGEGMLRLLGREDDVINTAGYKVAPSEVEDAASALAGIADCICIAAPHPVLGTVLKLLVVMKEGCKFDKTTVAKHIASRLEAYKVPVYYEQVASVRRTFNGKLDRKSYR
ncbi:class I adenylate-forming enzyme family protein [Prevotella sp. KH2C16]|uniref:class I adenylate-forming enzyme family protein n=1 Tax=Prevotella sp. KH2C16 TaxID=1855325 RepID=UPI0008EB05D3|nr:class I adenylate-forming enzyme family protein [Prevotella sp. KH2C16]SFF85391.1 long-chain acyl-CoA synthetase [Prevotella sp. KH2C16]